MFAYTCAGCGGVWEAETNAKAKGLVKNHLPCVDPIPIPKKDSHNIKNDMKYKK